MSSDRGLMAEVDSKAAYDEWHARYDVDREAATPWHTLVRKHLDGARDLEGRRILEIGCGRGGFACWLAAQPGPAEVVGADYSETAVQKAREHARLEGLSRVRFETADIQNIQHPASSFDTVISCETIEHVPDSRRAVTELARVLRPGGRLFLTCPNYLGTLGLYRAYLRLRGRPYTEEGQPINQLTMLPQTRRWFTQAGLKIVLTDSVGHYLPYPGRQPFEFPRLNGVRPLHWFGLHSLVVGEKA